MRLALIGLVLGAMVACNGGEKKDEPSGRGGSASGGSAGSSSKGGASSKGGSTGAEAGAGAEAGSASSGEAGSSNAAGGEGGSPAGGGEAGEGGSPGTADYIRFKYNGEQYDTRNFVSEFSGYTPRAEIIDDRLSVQGFFDDSTGAQIFIHLPDATASTVDCDPGVQAEISFKGLDGFAFKVWPGNAGFLADGEDLGCHIVVSSVGDAAGDPVTGTFEGILYIYSSAAEDPPKHAFITEGEFHIAREN